MASKSSTTSTTKTRTVKTGQAPRKRRVARKASASNGVYQSTVTSTQAQLDAHERECATRYAAVLEKLGVLDKKMWRLEGYLIFGVVAVIVAQFIKIIV
jgi:hypothetical protein